MILRYTKRTMITKRLGGEDFPQLNQIRVRQSLPHVDQYHTFRVGKSEICASKDQSHERIH